MIQFRPCVEKKLKTRTIDNKKHYQRAKSWKKTYRAALGGDYPTIESPKYQRIGEKMGRWSGKVKGKGLVHLSLHLLRNGELLKKKYMGKVILGKDKQQEGVSFSFMTKIPNADNWAWQIVAYI